MLVKECTVALLGAGLDPYWGFYHRPRHGRPALSLDLMEEFRPLVADSAVITAINTGMVGQGDFVTTAAGCALTATGRKAFIRAFEARMDTLATHPLYDYRCSWRRLVALQALTLARVLRGDIPEYVGLTTR
jgi:CRISPR-associated protein Cas1